MLPSVHALPYFRVIIFNTLTQVRGWKIQRFFLYSRCYTQANRQTINYLCHMLLWRKFLALVFHILRLFGKWIEWILALEISWNFALVLRLIENGNTTRWHMEVTKVFLICIHLEVLMNHGFLLSPLFLNLVILDSDPLVPWKYRLKLELGLRRFLGISMASILWIRWLNVVNGWVRLQQGFPILLVFMHRDVLVGHSSMRRNRTVFRGSKIALIFLKDVYGLLYWFLLLVWHC